MDTVFHNSFVWVQIPSVSFQGYHLFRSMARGGFHLVAIFQWHTAPAEACEVLSHQHFSTPLIVQISE